MKHSVMKNLVGVNLTTLSLRGVRQHDVGVSALDIGQGVGKERFSRRVPRTLLRMTGKTIIPGEKPHRHGVVPLLTKMITKCL